MSRVAFGLCPGSSDLIGWRTVTITEAWIGQRIAQFLAAEVKTALGQPRADQIAFLAAVQRAGGIASVVRSPDDLSELLGVGP